MLSTVQANSHSLCQLLILGCDLVRVFLVDGGWRAPFSRTVFLPSPVVPVTGEIDADANSVDQNEYEDSSYAVLAPFDMLV